MIVCAPYVLLTEAPKLIGLTVSAMEHKIARGQWLLGKEYVKGPDGRLYVNMKGFAEWVESANAPSMSENRRSA